MLVLSFKNGNSDPTRNSFDKHYMPLIEIIFDQPIKNKQETYEKLIEISKNNNYTTGNLLDYLYHQKYYKFIGIDLSRQRNIIIPQQIFHLHYLLNVSQKLMEQQ